MGSDSKLLTLLKYGLLSDVSLGVKHYHNFEALLDIETHTG